MHPFQRRYAYVPILQSSSGIRDFALPGTCQPFKRATKRYLRLMHYPKHTLVRISETLSTQSAIIPANDRIEIREFIDIRRISVVHEIKLSFQITPVNKPIPYKFIAIYAISLMQQVPKLVGDQVITACT